MRWTLLALIAIPAVGCVGYDRPVVRNLEAIGAPSVRNGPTGQDSLPPWGTAPEPAAKFSTQGVATDIASHSINVKPKSGKAVRVGIGELTLIDDNGDHTNWMALPEGVEVRASWSQTDAGPVAQRIEVLPRESGH